jgi:ParB family chromosome partitioning protein
MATGLGRGLGEIFDEVTQSYEDEIPSSVGASEIELDLIHANPYQPRKVFDQNSLEELAYSIRDHGLLQPIVVTEGIDGYTLISGERRLRAHKFLNLKTIKVVLADIPLGKFRELAIIENIQRDELNSIDLAVSYKELLEEHNITHEELSKLIHKSRTQITNTIRLLQLSDYTQKMLISEKITQGHAKVIIGLSEDKERIIADMIVSQKLSVRDTENYVKELKNKKEISSNKVDKRVVPKTKINFKELENFFSLFDVKTQSKANKITLSFKDEEEIKKFISKIQSD